MRLEKAEVEGVKVTCLDSSIFRCAFGNSANLCWHVSVRDSAHNAAGFCWPVCLAQMC